MAVDTHSTSFRGRLRIRKIKHGKALKRFSIGSSRPEAAVEQKHPKAAVDTLPAGLPSKQRGPIVLCLPTGEL
jgi:hypothetical protein